LDGRRYVITERLRGSPERGGYRGRGVGGERCLITLAPPQKLPYGDLMRQLHLGGNAVARLLHVGPLEDADAHGRYDAMVEEEPSSRPLAALTAPLDPGPVAALGASIARALEPAHDLGYV